MWQPKENTGRAVLAAVIVALASFAATRADAQSKLPLKEGVARVEGGYVVIPGEVTNLSGGWVRGVRIDVELFDAAGNSLLKDRCYAARDHLAPNEVTPFKYLRDVTKIRGTYARHKLEVSAVPAPSTLAAAVEGLQVSREGKGFRVKGTLRSTGSEACRNAQAIAVGYDTSGRVYDVEGIFPDTAKGGLPSGETVAFRLFVANDGGQITDVKALGGCAGK